MTAPPRPGADPHPSTLHSGGHHLPAVFSASEPSPAPPSRRRKPHKGLVFGLLGGAAVVAALSLTQLAANLGYDSAATQYEEAARSASAAQAAVRTDTAGLRTAAEAGELILAGGNQPLTVADDVQAAFATAVDDGAAAATGADGVIASDIPDTGTKPTWFWELFGATAELEQHHDEVSGLSDDLTAASAEVTGAFEALTESGLTVMTATAAAAPAFEAAHLSARNDAVIALRDAAADATATATVDESTVTTYLTLQDAAAQVVATESEEMAQKSGPLMSARLEIEAFARSLAPGVLLDFDWAPVVSGAGYNGSMGGYTTWWWDDPGRATIELSNSVAEQWPAERSRALIAHEVGHAISVKCQGMYDASTPDSIEKWATAWAISMGFTDDANGVWAYGYPPQEYIDAASGCR
ncbi:hypothetical protein [Microbacterium sp. MYb62]|uniref:hypothetical protein n=1 Tax=Microbacterium sp. MYb62 TaxID=1848690 RepID=UPI000CFD4F1F|nr:hypothetical protein [Microbacterium sp. MYb62]PRB12216.1 hypothetical protein CQ042_15505 [Microbacterium sp. MYb62]